MNSSILNLYSVGLQIQINHTANSNISDINNHVEVQTNEKS